MQIIWKGQSCFQIVAKKEKNSQVTVVIDPFSKDTGLRIPKLEADILLITDRDKDYNNIKAVSGNPFLIEGPGEYEVKGVSIQGIPAFQDNGGDKEKNQVTIYTIEVEEMRLCHLGKLAQKELTSGQLEKIGDVDILMVPIGGIPKQDKGKATISAKEAPKIMAQIEPKIIIPMHYQVPKLRFKLDGLDKFLRIMGIKSIEPLNKLSIKKRDLSEEEVKIIILKP